MMDEGEERSVIIIMARKVDRPREGQTRKSDACVRVDMPGLLTNAC